MCQTERMSELSFSASRSVRGTLAGRSRVNAHFRFRRVRGSVRSYGSVYTLRVVMRAYNLSSYILVPFKEVCTCLDRTLLRFSKINEIRDQIH